MITSSVTIRDSPLTLHRCAGRNGGRHVLPGGRAALFEIVHNSSGSVELAVVRFADRPIIRLGVHGRNPRHIPQGYIVFGQGGGAVYGVRFDHERLLPPEARILSQSWRGADEATRVDEKCTGCCRAQRTVHCCRRTDPVAGVNAGELLYRNAGTFLALHLTKGTQLRVGRRENLFADKYWTAFASGPHYDVSRDGARLVVVASAGSPDQPTLILQWAATIASKLPQVVSVSASSASGGPGFRRAPTP